MCLVPKVKFNDAKVSLRIELSSQVYEFGFIMRDYWVWDYIVSNLYLHVYWIFLFDCFLCFVFVCLFFTPYSGILHSALNERKQGSAQGIPRPPAADAGFPQENNTAWARLELTAYV